jgi:hypothetical protein
MVPAAVLVLAARLQLAEPETAGLAAVKLAGLAV